MAMGTCNCILLHVRIKLLSQVESHYCILFHCVCCAFLFICLKLLENILKEQLVKIKKKLDELHNKTVYNNAIRPD